jgi:hypothetical protein
MGWIVIGGILVFGLWPEVGGYVKPYASKIFEPVAPYVEKTDKFINKYRTPKHEQHDWDSHDKDGS